MKIKLSIFLLLLAVPLLFCISCSDGDSKDDLDDVGQNDTDTGSDKEKPDSDNTDTNTDDGSDSATDDADSDSGDNTDTETDTDTDTENTDTETDTGSDDDADTNPDDDADTNPDDDADTHSDDDADSGDSGSDDDTDTDTDTDADTSPTIIDDKEDTGVICTGQTKCYSPTAEIECPVSKKENYFGQDAQYNAENNYCLNRTYYPVTTDTVTDYNTGLVWQRDLPSIYTGCTVEDENGGKGGVCLHSEAVNYCKNLTLEGKDDWRLPTPEELGTIIDFGQYNPAIDSNFKSPGGTKQEFWTQTYLSSSSDQKKIWYVDFKTGKTVTGENTGRYVRCVRGNALEKADLAVKNQGDAQEIIEDSVHKLLWTKTPDSQTFSWTSALRHCQELKYNNVKGWRLPSINELASILDYSAEVPAAEFSGAYYFWSSTTYVGSKNKAWKIYTLDGRIENAGKTQATHVICVK